MPVKNTGTKELIKETAKKLLFAEGKLYLTTQDIADAAGINRTAVHYYFNTREALFTEVFTESMLALSQRLDKVITSDIPFKTKVENIITVYLEELIQFPYEETFLVMEINNAGQKLVKSISSKVMASFMNEIEHEMIIGTIPKMNPIHFIMNLFSLLSYPLIMAPLYKQFFHLSKKDFNQLIRERSEIISRLIFK